ncbi:28S ribosomal protein S31, mitochondrial isoform X2 [Pararge aegeria]|uniref:28S ribosomal protein S31, mitochondrial isoform X2 n=1 Tax=Pararge aegeria TaxID=116150 RepID=UPI0019D1325F|nr:28S ribosomal protein S31, mitochondrial isoform X2 [Pararge aegeria]
MLRIKRDIKFFVRCLSDKPPEHDSKMPEIKSRDKKDEKKDTDTESSTEKIQALLKLMLADPKISDSEYRERFTTAPERPKRQKPDVLEVKMEKIEENITKAAAEVAQVIGGNVKQTEADLLSKVLGKINQTSTTLSDLIVGMKVDRSRDSEEPMARETRGQQVKRLTEKSRVDVQRTRYSKRHQDREEPRPKQRQSMSQANTINIFTGEPLGIFEAKEPNYGTRLDLWEKLNQRELMLATSQPPANYFQKMIMWTEQGKVWKFPINNEQGMEEEKNVHFSEHIFLDAHLEGWCPTKGPIRHFMELVCVGLSKNAFYTVKEKIDHIMWYKEYFESKQDMLTEIGAWDNKSEQKSETSTPV